MGTKTVGIRESENCPTRLAQIGTIRSRFICGFHIGSIGHRKVVRRSVQGNYPFIWLVQCQCIQSAKFRNADPSKYLKIHCIKVSKQVSLRMGFHLTNFPSQLPVLLNRGPRAIPAITHEVCFTSGGKAIHEQFPICRSVGIHS